MEEWVEINGFPRYAVSNRGRVKDLLNHRELAQTIVQQGIPTVGLVDAGLVHRRSVPLLVALHWLPNEDPEHFDTPIQLDGNRLHCDVTNLMWRPRWFAVFYHREKTFLEEQRNIRFTETTDNHIFLSVRHASMYYGVLEKDIFASLDYGDAVYPGGLHFKIY